MEANIIFECACSIFFSVAFTHDFSSARYNVTLCKIPEHQLSRRAVTGLIKAVYRENSSRFKEQGWQCKPRTGHAAHSNRGIDDDMGALLIDSYDEIKLAWFELEDDSKEISAIKGSLLGKLY